MPAGNFNLNPNFVDTIVDQAKIASLEAFVAKVLKAYARVDSYFDLGKQTTLAINEFLKEYHGNQ